MNNLHIEIQLADSSTGRLKQNMEIIKSFSGEIYLWDDGHPWLTHETGIYILESIRKCNNNKMYLVATGSLGMPKKYLGYEVIEVNNAVLMFYNKFKHLKGKNQSQPNDTKGKFLCLTGKPEGYHRTGLIFTLWKNRLLDKCVYSYFGNDDSLKHNCSNFIEKELSEKFFSQVKNISPDNIKPVQIEGCTSIHYDGAGYDSKLYETTQFSVVPETYEWAGPPFHITEKTWRPIMNCHPFLIAGQPGLVEYLEYMGFNCFRDFWKVCHNNKDNHCWQQQNNETLIQNIRHWLEMDDKDWQEIQKIARQNKENFNLFLQKAEKTFDRLNDTIEPSKTELIKKFIKVKKGEIF